MIEPGLFEWLAWVRNGIPAFFTLEEYRDRGFNVELNSTPVWPESKYKLDESMDEFYERCHFCTKEILKRHEEEGENDKPHFLFL